MGLEQFKVVVVHSIIGSILLDLNFFYYFNFLKILIRLNMFFFTEKMSKPSRPKDARKFPELPPKYSSSRELRNKAEKIRRDRLNGLIEEMKMLVPIICDK